MLGGRAGPGTMTPSAGADKRTIDDTPGVASQHCSRQVRAVESEERARPSIIWSRRALALRRTQCPPPLHCANSAYEGQAAFDQDCLSRREFVCSACFCTGCGGCTTLLANTAASENGCQSEGSWRTSHLRLRASDPNTGPRSITANSSGRRLLWRGRKGRFLPRGSPTTISSFFVNFPP